jgi:uncharacterized low-complexity protein
MHHVPVVFDWEGIFTFKIFREALNADTSRLDMAPSARFPKAGDACVSADAGEHELPDVQGFDFCDFHDGQLPSVNGQEGFDVCLSRCLIYPQLWLNKFECRFSEEFGGDRWATSATVQFFCFVTWSSTVKMRLALASLVVLMGISLGAASVAQTMTTSQANEVKQAEERFAAADKNADGKLTLEEAKAGMPRIASSFSKIDVEEKGYVTLDQIKAMILKK